MNKILTSEVKDFNVKVDIDGNGEVFLQVTYTLPEEKKVVDKYYFNSALNDLEKWSKACRNGWKPPLNIKYYEDTNAKPRVIEWLT